MSPVKCFTLFLLFLFLFSFFVSAVLAVESLLCSKELDGIDYPDPKRATAGIVMIGMGIVLCGNGFCSLGTWQRSLRHHL